MVYSQDLIYQYRWEIDSLSREIEKLDNDSLVVNKLLDLLVLYPDGDPQRLDKIEEGLSLAEKLNMEPEMGIFYSDMGWYYFFQNDRENTIKNLTLSVKYCKETELVVYAYGILSNTYSWSGEHERAKEYADKCFEAAKNAYAKDDNERGRILSDAYMFMGDVYRYMEDWDTAREYYRKAVANLTFEKDYFSVLWLIANIHLGDATVLVPYRYFEYAMWLKYTYDISHPRRKQIIVYNLLKIGDASVLTTGRENMKTKELEEQRKTMLFTVIIITLLIILSILLVYLVYVNKKANIQLKKANEIKNRLFMILNHDFKQPIASLIGYLDLKASNSELISEDEVKILEEKTSRAANQLYTDMDNLLLWVKSQMESFEPDIRQISVNKLFEDIKIFFLYEERVNIQYDIEDNLSLRTDENYLKTIVRNFTQNSIKASLDIGKPVIWKAYCEGGKIVLSIENSGKKIEKQFLDLLYDKKGNEVSRRGAGLIIIRNLAKAINCKIKVKTGNEYGTTFYLIFDEADCIGRG